SPHLRFMQAQCLHPLLVHGDVVEIAKRILQSLERSQKTRPAFSSALACEQALEKLCRIPPLLHFNPHLVTAAGIEPSDMLALFLYLAKAPLQFGSCENRDRESAAVASESILGRSPLPRLQPCGDLQPQRA